MLKLSEEQRAQLADLSKKAAVGIRLLVSENAQLRDKLASLELQARLDRIKEAMDRSGAANPWGGEEARDAALRKMAEPDLDVLERAIRIVPDLSIAKIGELVDGAGRDESKPSSVSKAELDGYVMGG